MAKPIIDTEYLKEIEKARRELRALISNKNCAPIMLRLAWHDAGTYDVNTKTGGPNGSIRNEEEYTHSANSGLKIALDFCEQVKFKCPKITYADLYQVAMPNLEQRVSGFPWNLMRAKLLYFSICELALSNIYLTIDIKDILGITDMPKFFNGTYNACVLQNKLEVFLLQLEYDFNLFLVVHLGDEDAFFKDYAESHKKLSELGFTPPSGSKPIIKDGTVLAQSAVGVAVAAAVVILSYLYEVRKKK
ncbi:L-ascorbate peroxidase 3, peroxisomal [Olea europaea subsp. europaea]|uniref:L-ascorbate peroxidase 3, peroxisomal n=1 Tax=Olea europaea subsp. europaea TaxID=158383 RepID=A0A8S0S636_OLEEU|nr:L-ascorbate peroxidase 3, peroxisomal [Olea europaea subsp. europaea]